MKITVKLFASLREGRFGIDTLEYPDRTTVGTVLEKLGISRDQASIIFVNSKHADPEHELSADDIVALFPPIGGG